ncbi:MAG: SH3 domain-containing protein [Sphingopyxis sp.]
MAYRAQPGVVGQISDCAGGWCLFNVRGQSGWIATDGIWGDETP